MYSEFNPIQKTLFCIEVILLAFLIIKEIIIPFIKELKTGFKKPKSNVLFKLDQYTTDFVIKTLNDVIQYKTVYYIDSSFGKHFSNTNSMFEDISNEEISEAHEVIINDILDTIPNNMQSYLNEIYGDKWLLDYISIESLSLLLNYTKQTIESLTLEKFNNQ